MADPVTPSGSLAAPLVVMPRGISPQEAARAYQSMAGMGADGAAGRAEMSGEASGAAGGGDFAGLLQRAAEGAVQLGQQAEAQAMQALAGRADLTDVVQAVSRAELALQTTTAVRDRVVQAYQEIMRMPI